MKRLLSLVVVVMLAPAILFTAPSIYPTGTTIYDPLKTWNGYTVFDTPNEQGAVMIDMNGTLLRRWKEVAGVPGPFRLLPGGDLVGGSARRRPHQEAFALLQVNWKGETVWKFDRTELVEDRGSRARGWRDSITTGSAKAAPSGTTRPAHSREPTAAARSFSPTRT